MSGAETCLCRQCGERFADVEACDSHIRRGRRIAGEFGPMLGCLPPRDTCRKSRHGFWTLATARVSEAGKTQIAEIAARATWGQA